MHANEAKQKKRRKREAIREEQEERTPANTASRENIISEVS
jgi:hypothetical protein